ncbi:MAG TPA: radical SAM protein [Candidatus Lokiarchaeia archaeon]|nr:radical SAM protein [Candidatus Lokiarchaeia archaeon]
MEDRRTIVLIRPDFNSLTQYIYKQVNPPIGLGYLASYLEEHDFVVHVLDLALRRVEFNDLVEFIKKKNPLLVGLSALTAYYSGMKILARKLKQVLPGIVLVLGGVHASSLPECAIKECNADFAVIGEGEETLLELARAIEYGDSDYSMIKGIAYHDGDEVKITANRELIVNLDALPMPAWQKINPNKYPKIPHGTILKYTRIAPILSTRGCPFDCAYCASCRFWGQRIRFRSPAKIVDEIQYLHEKFGIREIHFWDDNLTLKRDHIIGICREIIKRKLNHMAFSTPNGVKVDTLDIEVMRWMKAAGFYSFTFAVESGSPRILLEMGKKISLAKIVQNTVIAHDLGIKLNSFFMIGFPGDTIETIRRTMQLANSIPLDYRTFFILKPLPGSKIFLDWVRSRDLLDYDWDDLKCYMEASDMKINQLSPAIITKMHKKAQNINYIPPRRLFNLLWIILRFFHFSQMKLQVERIVHVIAGYSMALYHDAR